MFVDKQLQMAHPHSDSSPFFQKIHTQHHMVETYFKRTVCFQAIVADLN